MDAMLLLSLLTILHTMPLSIAQSDKLVYACESLLCDPPKMCILQEQVAQCVIVLAPTPATANPLGDRPKLTNVSILEAASASTQLPAGSMLSGFGAALLPPTLANTQATTTTTPSPLAPLLNLFGGGASPISLPTLPPAPTTTTTPPVNICSLPPLTGTCNRARIMWYYDNETGMCERFSYSGCGNLNRFPSKIQCERTCLRRG